MERYFVCSRRLVPRVGQNIVTTLSLPCHRILTTLYMRKLVENMLSRKCSLPSGKRLCHWKLCFSSLFNHRQKSCTGCIHCNPGVFQCIFMIWFLFSKASRSRCFRTIQSRQVCGHKITDKFSAMAID